MLRTTGYGIATSLSMLGGEGYLSLYHLVACGGERCGTTNPIAGATNVGRVASQEWVYRAVGQSIAGTGAVATTSIYYARVAGYYLKWFECGTVGCNPTATSYLTSGSSSWVTEALQAASPAGYMMATQDPASTNTFGWYMTEAQFEKEMKRTPTTVNEYTNYNSSYKVLYGQYDPPTYDSTDSAAAAATYGSPGSQTQIQADGEDSLGAAATGTAAPGGGSTSGGATVVAFAPFTLLRPGEYESYYAYVERLRARGWLGTATVVAESPALLDNAAGYQYRAGTVTSVTIAGGTLVDAGGWPATAPTVATESVGITVRRQPASTGVAVVLPDSCQCPALDLSPLTSLAAGDSFPFGLLTWAKDGILGEATTGTTGPGDITVFGITLPLDELDPFMDLVRAALAFSMVAGVVWVYTRRTLGWGGTDD